jgi:hypothetical protein
MVANKKARSPDLAKSIGTIPFFNNYRVLIELQYEARTKKVRLTAYIVTLIEASIRKATNDPTYKVTSSEQLHKSIKALTKTTVAEYIENVCNEAVNIPAIVRVEVPAIPVETVVIDRAQAPVEDKPLNRGYAMPDVRAPWNKKKPED